MSGTAPLADRSGGPRAVPALLVWVGCTGLGVLLERLATASRSVVRALVLDLHLDLLSASDPIEPDRSFHYSRGTLVPLLACMALTVLVWWALKHLEDAGIVRVAAFSFVSALIITAWVW
jgi:hypothetical protein